MIYTQDQLESAGYHVPAAPIDDWRTYAEHQPVPGYFQFDWLSSRHPDLYDRFAISTVGLMTELSRIVDLSGLEVIDIGAGTGRSTIAAARQAKKVTAVDIFDAVVFFGQERIRQAGLGNVTYLRGDGANLPFKSSSFDACISSWAVLNYPEAYRVIRPDGYFIFLGAAPGALCGELTPILADEFPHLITEIAPIVRYDPACPDEDTIIQEDTWNGLPVNPPIIRHDFTYLSEYGDYQEAAAIFGRLYGPKARRYLLNRRQSCLAWRLRIEIARARK
jgi:SAM-dependent methyltransferase